jgi:hypothetical protein
VHRRALRSRGYWRALALAVVVVCAPGSAAVAPEGGPLPPCRGVSHPASPIWAHRGRCRSGTPASCPPLGARPRAPDGRHATSKCSSLSQAASGMMATPRLCSAVRSRLGADANTLPVRQRQRLATSGDRGRRPGRSGSRAAASGFHRGRDGRWRGLVLRSEREPLLPGDGLSITCPRDAPRPARDPDRKREHRAPVVAVPIRTWRIQVAYFLERRPPGGWNYYSLTRTSPRFGGHVASYINRTLAAYRHIAGIPTDRDPPHAP